MKYFTALISLLLTVNVVTGRQYNISTNHCHPCAGSTRVHRPLILLDHVVTSQQVCRQISEFKLQVQDIRSEAGRKVFSLENGLFDGDVSHLEQEHMDGEPRLCSASSSANSDGPHISMLSSIYSRLVDVHHALSFTENHHPWNTGCSVSISGLSNGVNRAMCSLHVIMRFSSQLDGFDNICEKEHCFRLHRGCYFYQEHSFIVLRHLRAILFSIYRDIVAFEVDYGCSS